MLVIACAHQSSNAGQNWCRNMIILDENVRFFFFKYTFCHKVTILPCGELLNWQHRVFNSLC